MKKITILSLIILIFSVVAFNSCQTGDNGGTTFFDIRKISKQNPEIVKLAAGEAYNQEVLKVVPSDRDATVTIWQTGDKGSWAGSKYLIFEIRDAAGYSGVLNIEFYRKGEDLKGEKIVLQSGELATKNSETPWLSCLMGILPGVKTKVVFPLSYLDAQQIFVTRSPRQLKGTLNGNRLDPADISKVDLRFGPFAEPWFTPSFEVASICLSDTLPVPYPPVEGGLIDMFGQRKDKIWPGKITGEDDLIKRNLDIEKAVSGNSFPAGFSKYGGWKEKKFRATGFFRTQNDGKRWWLVDPEGYAFLSAGIDCIRPASGGPVSGIEDLFEWLPGDTDKQYAGAYNMGRNSKNMDFYRSNLIRVFGDRWRERWSSVIAGLMRKYNFNTVGNWSDVSFARENKIPYVLPLNRFPSSKVQIYRDFPDVFSEEFLAGSREFASQLSEYKDDPYLVGYFLRNEPQWAFGYHNLAFEMFATSQESASKHAFVGWLKERYKGDIAGLNKAWSQSLSDFEALNNMTFKDIPTVAADSDFYAFTTKMVKRYIEIPCDEVAKIDRNHLNLGMRYAWISSDLLYKAGERFDVFSINGYGYDPPATAEIARRSGKPVMIGEFHHGAVDRDLPATGITGVLSQADRGSAYRNYIEQGFARPELIGMHYFQLIDQPYYGRSDGENYNIGIVTITNIPYPELTEAMTLTNLRIYDVAAGNTVPFKADIVKIPAIHY